MVACARASPVLPRSLPVGRLAGRIRVDRIGGPARASTGFPRSGGELEQAALSPRPPSASARSVSGKGRVVNLFESEFAADAPEHIPGMLFWVDEPFSVRAGLPAGPGLPLRVLRSRSGSTSSDSTSASVGGIGGARVGKPGQSRIAQIASREWIAAMIRMRPWHFGGVPHALSHLKNGERLGLDGEEP